MANESKLFNRNAENITKSENRQLADLKKKLSDSVKSSSELNKNLNLIREALADGVVSLEEFRDLVEEQVSLYDKLHIAQQISAEYVSNMSSQTADNIDRIKEEINQEKARYSQLKQNYADITMQEKASLELEREKNELYLLREQSEEATLRRYNAQKVASLAILTNTDEEVSSIEEKRQAQESLLEAIREEEELQEKIDKRKAAKDKIETRAQRELTAKKIAKGEKLDNESPTFATHVKNATQGAKEAFNINRNAGMSPIKALLSIKDVIKSGNDEQAASFNKVAGILSSGFNALNNMIDSAARVMESSYGKVNAAIDGTGKTFSDFVDGLSSLGVSPLIRQEKLLENLSQIATSGITSDLEQIALLTTIKDKTVASFDATDGNLRRLVRLNQNLGNLTAKQFGLAAVLRTELNAAFGDSSYMARMFQQLTGTVLDAVSANAMRGKTDSTNFYAVMETFAAGLYEAGVDEGTVSALAQGINYLGSGNVQALSGNKALQNLMLLSMDRAGLDYATILQQGLNTKDTYLLLSEIIDYLADITDNTKKNNVLRSSYANLFNLSLTDMNAIKMLSTNNTFKNYAAASTSMTGSWAQNQARNEMLKISDERTMFSEILNNFVENAKFSFGVGVASSKWAYPLNLVSRLGIQAGDALTDIGMNFKGKAVKALSAGTYLASSLTGIINLADDLIGNFKAIGSDKNTISQYFDFALKNGNGEGGIYAGSTTSNTIVNRGSVNFKSFDNTYEDNTKKSKVYEESSKWEEEEKAAEEDPNTKILKEFEKTLMKANEGDGYAFAVSLQGMSDGVLRSFASIFADEDAMMDTLTGKNNALEQNNTFIDYVQDTSNKPTSAANTSSGSSAK